MNKGPRTNTLCDLVNPEKYSIDGFSLSENQTAIIHPSQMTHMESYEKAREEMGKEAFYAKYTTREKVLKDFSYEALGLN